MIEELPDILTLEGKTELLSIIRKGMKENHLTVNRCARKLGMTRNNLSKVLNHPELKNRGHVYISLLMMIEDITLYND